MAAYLQINISTGVVTNRPVWDGVTGWQPSEGEMLLPDRPGVNIGYIYNSADGTFSAPPTPVPECVSRLQAQRALRQSGMLDSVVAAVATAGPEAQDAWDYAAEVHRDNPILAAVAGQLGMTSAQIDDLFRLAAGL